MWAYVLNEGIWDLIPQIEVDKLAVVNKVGILRA